MRRQSLQATLVMVFLLLSLSACSSSKPMSPDEYFHRAIIEQTNLINQHITDPKKHARCMAQMERMDVLLRGFGGKLTKQATDVEAMVLDYGATREQFETMGRAFDEEQEAFLNELLEIRMEIRKLTSQEEWARISSREYKILGY